MAAQRNKADWDHTRRKIDDVVVGLSKTANLLKEQGKLEEAEGLVNLAAHLQGREHDLFRVSLVLQ